MRIVGGDLPRVAARLGPGLLAAGCFLRARSSAIACAHRLGVQHVVDHRAAVRQVGADHRRAQAAEMRAQHARGLAHGALRIEPFGDHVAQAHRRAEVHDGVAAVEQDRQKPAEAADHHPVLGEQYAEPAGGAVGRAADEDRHRDHVDVELGIGRDRRKQFCQAAGVRQRAWPAFQPAPRRDSDSTARSRRSQPPGTGLSGGGSPASRAASSQDHGVGQAIALEHVDHRHVGRASTSAGRSGSVLIRSHGASARAAGGTATGRGWYRGRSCGRGDGHGGDTGLSGRQCGAVSARWAGAQQGGERWRCGRESSAGGARGWSGSAWWWRHPRHATAIRPMTARQACRPPKKLRWSCGHLSEPA